MERKSAAVNIPPNDATRPTDVATELVRVCCEGTRSQTTLQTNRPAFSSAPRLCLTREQATDSTCAGPFCQARREPGFHMTRGVRKGLRRLFSIGTTAVHRISDIQRQIITRSLRQPTTTAIMKAPSTALLRAFSPLFRTEGLPWTARGCLSHTRWQPRNAPTSQPRADFSSSAPRMARKKGGPKIDMRIRM